MSMLTISTWSCSTSLLDCVNKIQTAIGFNRFALLLWLMRNGWLSCFHTPKLFWYIHAFFVFSWSNRLVIQTGQHKTICLVNQRAKQRLLIWYNLLDSVPDVTLVDVDLRLLCWKSGLWTRCSQCERLVRFVNSYHCYFYVLLRGCFPNNVPLGQATSPILIPVSWYHSSHFEFSNVWSEKDLGAWSHLWCAQPLSEQYSSDCHLSAR